VAVVSQAVITTTHDVADFGFNPSIDDLVTSNCTSCSITEDKSAYWTPRLYFQHDNGTFEEVPTVGGMTA